MVCNTGVLHCGNKKKINIAEENFRCLTGRKPEYSLSWTQLQRVILEDAAIWGRNEKILEEIQQCAEQLNYIVSGLRQQGRTVILAPLHIVSDTLAAIVASLVAPKFQQSLFHQERRSSENYVVQTKMLNYIFVLFIRIILRFRDNYLLLLMT
ncbi:hypothetical protein O5268_23445 [Escherichia coli]|nr:hypothetical protein [Escherichia coli]